mmetsp:Transcript_6106/g.10331  ORF Transcript_6106/g.10331 Transcript_6106/m.10331 type:complete len:353 (+) Transcript_6106:74-1132(+)
MHHFDSVQQELQTKKNSTPVGRTVFILAIVILPTTLLVLLGYIAYYFIGHAGENIAFGVEEDGTNIEDENIFDRAETNNDEATNTETQQTRENATTIQSVPTNIISTAFTPYEQVPHDATSWTQGLSYGDDGYIYETTGLRGQSKLLKIDPTTFEVIKSVYIDDFYFGEGSTFYTDADGNDRLIFITYEEQTAFIFDPLTLTKLKTLTYKTTPPWNEGWGITFDSVEGEFIVSDGTSTLFFMDRDTLQVKRKIVVTRFDGTEQDSLNELELMGGLICCNIWYEDEIICVDKITGRSVREYDLSTLHPIEERGYSHVMNGIALGEDHVLITGKRWDRMYKVRFDDWDGLFTGN